MKTNNIFLFLFLSLFLSLLSSTISAFRLPTTTVPPATNNYYQGGAGGGGEKQSYDDQYMKDMDKYFRLWYHNPRAPMTCDLYPKVCNFPGSFGESCCQKRCVNLKFDPFNCGQCGKRCGFGQICCQGKCVNLLFDKNNCGWCGNRCMEGSSCRYGMCSYA